MRTLFFVCLLAGCSNAIDFEPPPNSDTGAVQTPGGTDAPVDSGDGPTMGGNRSPVADAGPDLTGTVPEEIVLDGSGSEDPDGDVLNYSWVLLDKPGGSAAFLINENRVDASFYADRDGLYVAELTVDDGLLSSTDEVEIQVSAPNAGPVANAGIDQNVEVGQRVTLNGANSYDPDGSALVYQWTVVSLPTGSAATLDSRTVALPEFTADATGAYVIELRVSDGVNVSPADEVRVVASTAAGNGGCLSCSAAQRELGERYSAGNAASSMGLLFLPLALLWYRRRHDDRGVHGVSR